MSLDWSAVLPIAMNIPSCEAKMHWDNRIELSEAFSLQKVVGSSTSGVFYFPTRSHMNDHYRPPLPSSIQTSRSKESLAQSSIVNQYIPPILGNIYTMAKHRYDRMTLGESHTWTLIACNLAVFFLWRLPPLGHFMNRNFVHHSHSRRIYTMVTSAFSQKGVAHLAFNMFALNSFFISMHYLHPMTHQEAIAFYLSTAALSSLGSQVFMRLSKNTTMRSSLGSSGVVWAIVAFVAYQRPESQAGIIFIPGVEMPLGTLVSGFILLDLAGLLMKWKQFDHAAHLSGALAGYLYSKYGSTLWSDCQRYILQKWVNDLKKVQISKNKK
ncbi:hypothetical protein BDEG_25102 [Batrachochytrium dendrobatidis JEL423]|nr:hypothetical protein BDEG_25102 [Batrachochytrium dendrobatidis JEL423]